MFRRIRQRIKCQKERKRRLCELDALIQSGKPVAEYVRLETMLAELVIKLDNDNEDRAQDRQETNDLLRELIRVVESINLVPVRSVRSPNKPEQAELIPPKSKKDLIIAYLDENPDHLYLPVRELADLIPGGVAFGYLSEVRKEYKNEMRQ